MDLLVDWKEWQHSLDTLEPPPWLINLYRKISLRHSIQSLEKCPSPKMFVLMEGVLVDVKSLCFWFPQLIILPRTPQEKAVHWADQLPVWMSLNTTGKEQLPYLVPHNEAKASTTCGRVLNQKADEYILLRFSHMDIDRPTEDLSLHNPRYQAEEEWGLNVLSGHCKYQPEIPSSRWLWCPTCCHYPCFQVTFQNCFQSSLGKYTRKTRPGSVHPCVCFAPIQNWPESLQPIPHQITEAKKFGLIESHSCGANVNGIGPSIKYWKPPCMYTLQVRWLLQKICFLLLLWT